MSLNKTTPFKRPKIFFSVPGFYRMVFRCQFLTVNTGEHRSQLNYTHQKWAAWRYGS